ncbi:MAG: PaaI family thioesterase [Vicinamibacterales bacterium]|jgi:acyl-coenzyme A thioesterase PaaI-like protein|nr:PaaI family thioesterase [Vicinamibacterales bacterium]
MSMQDASAIPPPALPDEGWEPFQPFPELAARESFVSGGPSTHRLRVAYYRRPGDARLLGRAWFGPETQGPPGHAHGGAVSAVMDEALGAVAWADGHPVVVARLCVDFRHMVPLGTDATFETWVERVDGRKVRTRGRLLDAAGRLLAEGEALCVVIGSDHVEKFEAARAAKARRSHR